jgi:hypothetical protein
VTPADVLGALLLLAGVVIAGCELLLWSNLRADLKELAAEQALDDERPDTTPAPYVVGSEADPFAVDLARFRR